MSWKLALMWFWVGTVVEHEGRVLMGQLPFRPWYLLADVATIAALAAWNWYAVGSSANG